MDLDEIRLGLESFTPPPLRMAVVDRDGVRFVNDSLQRQRAVDDGGAGDAGGNALRGPQDRRVGRHA